MKWWWSGDEMGMVGQEHVQINSQPWWFWEWPFKLCFIFIRITMVIHCQMPKALLKLGPLSSQSCHEITTEVTNGKFGFWWQPPLDFFSLSPLPDELSNFDDIYIYTYHAYIYIYIFHTYIYIYYLLYIYMHKFIILYIHRCRIEGEIRRRWSMTALHSQSESLQLFSANATPPLVHQHPFTLAKVDKLQTSATGVACASVTKLGLHRQSCQLLSNLEFFGVQFQL